MLWLIGFLLLANLVVFVVFGLDKRRAGRRQHRVSEATLLGLALPLATPGAWLAMATFRHKTQKTSFRLKMALVTLVNLALVWGLWRWLS